MYVYTKSRVQIYRNPLIQAYFEELDLDERHIAARTIDFIKQNFPECVEPLNGELVSDEEV